MALLPRSSRFSAGTPDERNSARLYLACCLIFIAFKDAHSFDSVMNASVRHSGFQFIFLDHCPRTSCTRINRCLEERQRAAAPKTKSTQSTFNSTHYNETSSYLLGIGPFPACWPGFELKATSETVSTSDVRRILYPQRSGMNQNADR